MKHRSVLLGALVCALTILLLFNARVAAQTTVTVDGQITDRNGDPIPGAEVHLFSGETLVNSTVSDVNGYYSFGDVEPGDYTVLVYTQGEQLEQDISIPLFNGTNITRDFIFENLPYSDDDDDDDDEGSATLGLACSAIFLVAILLFIGILIVIIIIWKQYSKITSERLMEHETRQRILTFLNENPGGHLRGIKEGLGLPMGVLTHHIYKMEQEEVIKSRMEGKYRRFYPYNFKITKAPLLTGTQKTIVDQIQQTPGISPTDIADKLGKSRKTVYYHVQELEAKGVLHVNRQEKQYKCFISSET